MNYDMHNKEIQPQARWLSFTWDRHYDCWRQELDTLPILRDVMAILFILITFLNSFYVNSAYERSLITHLGKVKEVTDPGLHFKIPFIEHRHVADTRMMEIKLENWIATKGGANRAMVTMIINHRIKPDNENIKKLFLLFGSGFDYEDRLFGKAATDRLKSSVSKREIAAVTDDRDQIRSEVLEKVIILADEYGILVKDLQIQSVDFAPEYMEKLAMVQDARAKAAAAKEEKIREGFLADKKIELARGDAESTKINAAAAAYKIEVESVQKAAAIDREGAATAKAILAQTLAAKNSEGLAELRRAEAMKNWTGEVPQFSGGGIFPFMNIKDFSDKSEPSTTSSNMLPIPLAGN